MNPVAATLPSVAPVAPVLETVAVVAPELAPTAPVVETEIEPVSPES